ncbi:hypothetical protein BDZ88DRAFT_203122 [Geranomyces variabilis]|nr:hypothetical protein BDZ88DRAFT_203122 [Geranomyces variabilis]KAJ3137605.1 putative protein CXorf58 [Geranomyces variabilis]
MFGNSKNESSSDAYHDLLGLPPLPPHTHFSVHEAAPPSASVIAQGIAVAKIQKLWKSFLMRRTFHWLKESLIRAERSMTMEILRRLCPKEAELMRDPVVQAKVRFRFGGQTFPPTIMYKIYTKSSSVHYYSGNRLIQADTQAAVDSCTIMGVRLYSENVMRTEFQNRGLKVAHSDEVTNRLDFVQYISSLDQKPAYMGGRNNTWRELAVTPSAGFPDLVFDMSGKRTAIRKTSFRRLRSDSRLAAPTSRKCSSKPARTRMFQLTPEHIHSNNHSPLQQHDHHHHNRHQHHNHHHDDAEVLDDEFDPLYEWTNHLTIDGLDDYIVGKQ